MTVTNPNNNPITNGPFGQVSTLTYFFPGFFNSVGANAQTLATLEANSSSALAYIPKGTLGAGSGGVVLFSDVSLTVDGFLTTNNSIAIRNAIAFAAPVVAPEPTTLTLLALGIIIPVARRRRNANTSL